MEAFSDATDGKSTTTAIVGAGIIGLATAFSLAKRRQQDVGRRRIVVIDAQDGPFAAASGHNSGCLAFHWLNDHLKPLGKYSFELWEGLAKDPRFQAVCGYKDHALWTIHTGETAGYEQLPAWVRTENGWRVAMEPANGRGASINPILAGVWLHSQCVELGVEFRFSTSIASAKTSKQNHVRSVELQTPDGMFALSCEHLVLAAGVWTPSLYKCLFPSSPIDMHPVLDSSNYMILPFLSTEPRENIGGVIFEPLVGHKLEFVARSDQTLWMCAYRDDKTPLPAVGAPADTDERAVRKMKEFVAQYIRDSSDGHSAAVNLPTVSIGRAYRPALKSGIPIIAPVPSKRLGKMEEESDGEAFSGVYLCCGHGMSGLAMGMGTGNLMSQLIEGQTTDIDIAKYGLPGR